MTGPDEPHDHPQDHRPDPDPDSASDPGVDCGGGEDTRTEAAPSSSLPPAGGPAAPGRERWHGEAVRDGQGMRALHADLAALRRELQSGLRAVREELRDDVRNRTSELSGYLSELLPKVDDLEDALAQLRGNEPDGGPGPRPDSGAAGAKTAAQTGPPPTPAAGWDQMDRATAETAWAELARFVDEVLYGGYRLSRLQIPDCWPVHPRMVRELAWLRSEYLEARGVEDQAPAASMNWHIRGVPGFLVNTADAVDPRECRPGIHRLTDHEVNALRPALSQAYRTGQPIPPPSPETGPARPRLRPEHFPTRGVGTATSSAAGRSDGPPAPTTTTLPDLIVDACHRDYWLDYYREASAADLATRPTGPPGPPPSEAAGKEGPLL